MLGEVCIRCQACSCSASGWRRAGGCGLQILSSQNSLVILSFFPPAWISSNSFLQPERVTLLQNPSLPFTGRVAVSPPEHSVIYSLPRSQRLHSPLCTDCRQHSCQRIRCHGIALQKHPAFTLCIFPPVQAETAHKQIEGPYLYIYKSPFFIPCRRKTSVDKGGAATPNTRLQSYMCLQTREASHMCIHAYIHTCIFFPCILTQMVSTVPSNSCVLSDSVGIGKLHFHYPGAHSLR